MTRASTHATGRAVREAATIVRRPGRAIQPARRRAAERSLGHDFRDIRIHTDDEAGRHADAVGVSAFAVGRDIAFAPGAWRPGTMAGDRLIAHELAHAAQQANGSGPPVRLSSPAEERDADASATAVLEARIHRPLHAARSFAAKDGPTSDLPALDLLNPYAEPSEEQKQQIEDEKKKLLASLDRYSSVDVLYQLRNMSVSVRLALFHDDAFMKEIRKRIWGKGFWIIQLRLKYGDRQPGYVRQLSLAMLSKDARAVADLLRGFPALTDPDKVPGVYEVLAHEFRDHPRRAMVLRLAREKVTASKKQTFTYDATHYEKPKGGGAWALKKYSGRARYDLARTANELRIVVRTHLVDESDRQKTHWPSDERMKGWRDRMDEAWNNRYAANNGTNRLRIVFAPVFTRDDPHWTVKIHTSESYYRSSKTNWWDKASPSTVAHEFGHMIGNPDEYNLAAKMSDIPKSMGMSEADRKRSTVEGVRGKAPKDSPVGGTDLEGIMGSAHEEGSHAERRHVWPILHRYNRTLKPAEENDYVLVSD